MRTSDRRSLALAIRRADRRVYAEVAAVAGLGGWLAFTGPFVLAPVCWAAAIVMYWRRGVATLTNLRNEPAAWPILGAPTPVAKVVKHDKP